MANTLLEVPLLYILFTRKHSYYDLHLPRFFRLRMKHNTNQNFMHNLIVYVSEYLLILCSSFFKGFLRFLLNYCL